MVLKDKINTEENPTFAELSAIANWQLDAENAKVGLPALQRGYVWKPKQVETLWDSLLRGFPIGSFLVSNNKKINEKKDLLDGQQRATSIAMGFYNPWADNDVKHPTFFSAKFKNIPETVPVLWLDIACQEEEEKGDFIFLPRLVTQSHPWGFNHNSNVLGIASRRKANEHFCGTYPHYNLKDVFPWDAILPVPLVFLIEAMSESIENWKENLIEKSKRFLSHIRLHYFNESTTYITKLQELLNDKNISAKIEEGITMVLNTRIPVILLNKKQREDESNSANADTSTLFVRINTLGTPLNGEELIYSIFKTIFPESKEIVEAAGTSFIAPSRIITLISRIALTDFSANKEEFKFHNQLNLKQFKTAIKDSEGKFFIKMKEFAEEEKVLKLLFENAKSLLIGEKEYQLPFPLAVEIARNQDVFFVFLYWLYKSKINVVDIMKDEALHKKILSALTTLNWFALDMTMFLNELASMEGDKIEFWNPKLFSKKGAETRYIANLRIHSYVREKLENKINKSWDDVFTYEEEKNEFMQLFDKLNGNRSMLFYAQRQYFHAQFKELQWDTLLEDTNRPYDWDHIYPDSWWTYNIPNYSPVTQEWRWSIGNFRVLTLEDNRSEGAKSPKERLIKIERRTDSFITENNWLFWKQIDGKILESQVETLAKAIVNRVADVYEDWYSALNVGKLFDFENNNQ